MGQGFDLLSQHPRLIAYDNPNWDHYNAHQGARKQAQQNAWYTVGAIEPPQTYSVSGSAARSSSEGGARRPPGQNVQAPPTSSPTSSYLILLPTRVNGRQPSTSSQWRSQGGGGVKGKGMCKGKRGKPNKPRQGQSVFFIRFSEA